MDESCTLINFEEIRNDISCHESINSMTLRHRLGGTKPPQFCRTSGDENGALRPATSPRDAIFLLSLSLVSHENHRRRRLLECRSPLLSSCTSSTISCFSSTTFSATTTASPLLHSPSCNWVSFLALSHRCNPRLPSFATSSPGLTGWISQCVLYLSFFLFPSLFLPRNGFATGIECYEMSLGIEGR